MERHLEHLQAVLPAFLENGIAAAPERRVERLEGFVHSLRALEKAFEEVCQAHPANVQSTSKAGADLEAALQEVIGAYLTEKEDPRDFAGVFPEFDSRLETLLAEMPAIVVMDQGEDRFRSLADDSLRVRLGKAGKRFKRRVQVLRIGLGNVFRREKRSPGPWKQEVPFKDLVRYHLGLQLIPEAATEMRDVETGIFNRILRMRDRFRAWERRLISPEVPPSPAAAGFWEEMIEGIASIRPQLRNRLSTAVQQRVDLLRADLPKADTLELSAGRILSRIAPREFQKTRTIANSTISPWIISREALLAEWKDQAGLTQVQMSLLYTAARQDAGLSTRISKRILPFLDEAGATIAAMIAEAEACPRKKTELEPVLRKLGQQVKENLGRNCIFPLADALMAQNFPLLIEKVEQFPNTHLPDKSVRWTYVGQAEENQPLLRTRIEQLAIREILDYEFLPAFSHSFQDIQSNLTQSLAAFRNRGTEVVQIVDFNLQTGLVAMDEGSSGPEAAHESVKDGLNRAADNLAGLRGAILDSLHGAREKMSAAAGELAASLESLKDPGSVQDIRSRLLRTKAIQRSNEIRRRTWNYIRYAFPMLWNWGKRQVRWLRREAEEIGNRLGLARPNSVITTQVSDFLAESELAIERLPLVYQRLFRVEPVTDDLLFVPRPRSLEALENAYANWRLDRYAPTVLVAEPGAGRSSLLLKWLAIHRKPAVKAVSLQPERRLKGEAELCVLISAALEIQPCALVPELIAAINDMQLPRIVLVEDLEQYFLKHIGGFAVLRAFIRIISETNPKVFWLFSASAYAWKYLCKTLHIDDAFGYVVELEPFSDEEIREIVLKRHRLSGFRIEFTPSELDLKNPAFRRTPGENRPELLKSTYFADLNRFAASNLAISFLFWMRSAMSIEDSTLKVSSLKDIDFSFMDELPNAKAVVLHQLLIHDGLNPAEVARTLGISEAVTLSTLLLLIDDGILLRQANNNFLINPLLYRHTIHMLQKRNFIH